MKDRALIVIDMQNGFLNERSPLYIDGAAVTVLSDCTSSKTPEIQESNLRDMANVGAVIASSKEIIEGS